MPTQGVGTAPTLPLMTRDQSALPLGAPVVADAALSQRWAGWPVAEPSQDAAPKVRTNPLADGSDHAALTLGVRPEHLSLEATPGALALPITITGVEQLGGHSLLYGTLPNHGPRITAQVAGQVATKIGDTATVYARPESCRLFASGNFEQAVH